jgi:hypothetical protein
MRDVAKGTLKMRLRPSLFTWFILGIVSFNWGFAMSCHAQSLLENPESTKQDPKPALLDRNSDPTKDVGPTEKDIPLTPPPAPAPPLGFTGKSGVIPRSGGNNDFVPVEDRWRLGFPWWDRYNRDFPRGEDYPYKKGDILDPYNQNVLKGDYPIRGQQTFFTFTGTLQSLVETRQLPTGTTPFESTAREFTTDFFGRPNQLVYNQNLFLSFELAHGYAPFKPVDWRLKITPAFNLNMVRVQELGVISPDVTKGTNRDRTFISFEEWFAERKLADLSSEYDFVSFRVGSQPFISDFRGFIFSDINRGARLFGTLDGNRTQFNLAYFRQAEKDVNSGLNTYHDRNQNIVMANIYRQDFIWPGYTLSGSFHFNQDNPSFLFDRNRFLVRPDPSGVFQPHRVESYYLGFAGDGHINRINISHAFYWAFGRDSMNPLAGKPIDINAKMAALELSYDRDWIRFRSSGFYSSGDGNINDSFGTGFDSILDNTNFAGSEFSFFGRQQIPLFGVNISQRGSLYPDMRSSKIQGQSNFVNPGLWLVNAGIDFEITPKFRLINNYNYMWFDKTNVLEKFTFQDRINRDIGVDISIGAEYRPMLNNNVIILAGLSSLIPATGFKQLYRGFGDSSEINPLLAGFVEVVLKY